MLISFLQLLNFSSLFQDRLYRVEGAYATILTMGAIGSIIGALLASKIKAGVYNLLILWP